MARTSIPTTELLCLQGATFSRQVEWQAPNGTPINLTGRTARMQVRPAVDSDEVLVSLTTENGRITLGGALGTIDLLIDAATTADLPAGRHKYDLEVVFGATVDRVLQGTFVVDPEVTR